MVLIGSRALSHYLPLSRVLHDWDFLASNEEFETFKTLNSASIVKTTPYSTLFDLPKGIVEIKSKSQFDESDKILFQECIEQNNIVKYDNADFLVPSIQRLYDIKKATAQCIDEWKHQYDLQLIKKHYPEVIDNTLFYQLRLEEITKRRATLKKEKYEFFHKYNIPEYIEHDSLHEMIADLLSIRIPTYQRIIDGTVSRNEEMFNKLTFLDKVNLMVEESLVIALERWFVPQMIENGINYKLVEKFYNNNEASPTYFLLMKVCIKGLQTEDEYITNFSRENFNIIEKTWIKAKKTIQENNGFPRHFYDKLFELRERYKKGEKVGLHHG